MRIFLDIFARENFTRGGKKFKIINKYRILIFSAELLENIVYINFQE